MADSEQIECSLILVIDEGCVRARREELADGVNLAKVCSNMKRRVTKCI